MSGVLEHRGYVGSAKYSSEDHVFYGKLEGIRDLVTYEAADVSGLEQSFKEAVDDYVTTCSKRGKTPQTPFKGSFNVRVGKELHMRAAAYAAETETKLNAVVSEALLRFLESQQGRPQVPRKAQSSVHRRREIQERARSD